MSGGEGGIRTPGTLARTPHFECGAIDHSATSPRRRFTNMRTFGSGRALARARLRAQALRRRVSVAHDLPGSVWPSMGVRDAAVRNPSGGSRDQVHEHIEPLPLVGVEPVSERFGDGGNGSRTRARPGCWIGGRASLRASDPAINMVHGCCELENGQEPRGPIASGGSFWGQGQPSPRLRPERQPTHHCAPAELVAQRVDRLFARLLLGPVPLDEIGGVGLRCGPQVARPDAD